MSTTFVTDLESHGYFRGLEPAHAQALKDDLRQRGWSGIFGESHRWFLADAEELAEGGICQFIGTLTPFLSAQGVVLPELEDDFSEDGYSVRVAGRSRVIYDAADLQQDFAGRPGLSWGLATARGFAIVDELLAAAGSPERLYAVNGGNDLAAYFLTPDLHRIICAQPNAKLWDGPYRLRETYPDFGQPAR